MSSPPMLTAQCPACPTTLSYPAHSTYIQCPRCSNTFSPSQQPHYGQQMPAPPLPPSHMPMDNSMSQTTKYVHCFHCKTLLSHPLTSLTIQCPKCLTIMDIPASNAMGTPDAAKGITTGSRKKRKDPAAPKRASNAYMIFCKEKRAELKKNRPDLPFGQLGKRLGEMWRSMSAEERAPYESRATNDRDRYKGQMNEYQSMTMMKGAASLSGDSNEPENGELENGEKRHKADDSGNLGGMLHTDVLEGQSGDALTLMQQQAQAQQSGSDHSDLSSQNE